MAQTTSPTLVVGLLMTGIVLILYSVHQVTDVLRRMTNEGMQRALTKLARYPLLAFGLGILATTLMQSSSAMSYLLVGLLNVNLIPLSSAIVIQLGANVGSTLVVQLLAFHITNYALELVGLGALIGLLTYKTDFRWLGRASFALGLMVLGLSILSLGSQPIAASPLTASALHILAGAPLVLFLIGAVLAMILGSSTASIGLILTLADTGSLPVVAALALMLGANAGITFTTLLSSLRESTQDGRRLALIHTGTKLVGALILLTVLGPLANLLASLWSNAGTQVAMMHLAFNVALALFFVPLARPLAHLMQRLIPTPRQAQSRTVGPRYLDARALVQPAVALGQAARETLHTAEIVAEMLEHSMNAFEESAGDLRASIVPLDEQLNELHAAVKGYLKQLDKRRMTDAQTRQELTLLYIIADLQAIGDTIVTKLASLIRLQQDRERPFSAEGRQDLLTYYREILGAFQQVLAALATYDSDLASTFLAHKKAYSQLKLELRQRHIHRLSSGNELSLASSSIHLELLEVLSEIFFYTTSIAYVLRAQKEKSESWTAAIALPVLAVAESEVRKTNGYHR